MSMQVGFPWNFELEVSVYQVILENILRKWGEQYWSKGEVKSRFSFCQCVSNPKGNSAHKMTLQNYLALRHVAWVLTLHLHQYQPAMWCRLSPRKSCDPEQRECLSRSNFGQKLSWESPATIPSRWKNQCFSPKGGLRSGLGFTVSLTHPWSQNTGENVDQK